MRYVFVCLHCHKQTEKALESAKDELLVQCEHCQEAAWRLRCNCTGLIANDQCMDCGEARG